MNNKRAMNIYVTDDFLEDLNYLTKVLNKSRSYILRDLVKESADGLRGIFGQELFPDEPRDLSSILIKMSAKLDDLSAELHKKAVKRGVKNAKREAV